jgi:hypothetical protein
MADVFRNYLQKVTNISVKLRFNTGKDTDDFSYTINTSFYFYLN